MYRRPCSPRGGHWPACGELFLSQAPHPGQSAVRSHKAGDFAEWAVLGEVSGMARPWLTCPVTPPASCDMAVPRLGSGQHVSRLLWLEPGRGGALALSSGSKSQADARSPRPRAHPVCSIRDGSDLSGLGSKGKVQKQTPALNSCVVLGAPALVWCHLPGSWGRGDVREPSRLLAPRRQVMTSGCSQEHR